MKRFVCIALSVLHLLSIVGGYWLFFSIQQINKQELAGRLDTDSYAGSETITIKLPLDGAYASDHENYERVDGDLEYEGIVYRMVKQKFYKDTVYIVCYKDDRSIAIKGALNEYSKSLGDCPVDGRQAGKSAGLFIKDYLVSDKKALDGLRPAVVIEHIHPYQNNYQHACCLAVEYPPEVIA